MRMISILLAGLFLGSPTWAQESDRCRTCGNEQYGTSVEWAGSPSEAAAMARKQEKLVFILHVSGYFEDPKFT